MQTPLDKISLWWQASSKHQGRVPLPVHKRLTELGWSGEIFSLQSNCWHWRAPICKYIPDVTAALTVWPRICHNKLDKVVQLSIYTDPIDGETLAVPYCYTYTSLILAVDHSPVRVSWVISWRDGMHAIMRLPSWQASSSAMGSMTRFLPKHDYTTKGAWKESNIAEMHIWLVLAGNRAT